MGFIGKGTLWGDLLYCIVKNIQRIIDLTLWMSLVRLFPCPQSRLILFIVDLTRQVLWAWPQLYSFLLAHASLTYLHIYLLSSLASPSGAGNIDRYWQSRCTRAFSRIHIKAPMRNAANSNRFINFWREEPETFFCVESFLLLVLS